MNRLRTSLTITWHSLQVLQRNPRLLVFPLVSLVMVLLVYAFFFVPMMLDKSLAETWHALRNPGEGWDSIAPWQAASAANGSPWGSESFLGLAVYYLLAMFATTFVNVALYSQIIAAMNGNRVSVRRGFLLACEKVPAIAVWSLLAGTVGLLLRAIQERVGFLGKWITGLIGLSWSAASVFVIPVLINEPRTRSPFDYLKISSALLKRVWGEGLIGLSGVWLVGVLVFVPLFALQFGAIAVTGEFSIQIAYVTSLAGLVIFTLLYLAYQIFECGLYVYATEGVAPGTFDEALFERVWTVREGTTVGEVQQTVRRRPWAKLWLIVPAALGCVPLWLKLFTPSPPFRPVLHSESHIGSAAVNLADLKFRLTMEDLHAAGLFIGDDCTNCGLSTAGSMEESFIGKPDAQFQPILFKHADTLYLHFYGLDVENGHKRILQSLDVLRSRFPGHAAAINVLHGRQVEWDAIPGAASYTLEVDCLDCCQQGSWCTDVGSKWKVMPGVTKSPHGFEWIGMHPGRWRVWAVDSEGRAGHESDWTYFEFNW